MISFATLIYPGALSSNCSQICSVSRPDVVSSDKGVWGRTFSGSIRGGEGSLPLPFVIDLNVIGVGSAIDARKG